MFTETAVANISLPKKPYRIGWCVFLSWVIVIWVIIHNPHWTRLYINYHNSKYHNQPIRVYIFTGSGTQEAHILRLWPPDCQPAKGASCQHHIAVNGSWKKTPLLGSCCRRCLSCRLPSTPAGQHVLPLSSAAQLRKLRTVSSAALAEQGTAPRGGWRSAQIAPSAALFLHRLSRKPTGQNYGPLEQALDEQDSVASSPIVWATTLVLSMAKKA